MAAENTLMGEVGKGAFWGTVIGSGLLMIKGLFSAAAAGFILNWAIGIGAITGTIHGINMLVKSISKK